jgi:hypothetical protein
MNLSQLRPRIRPLALIHITYIRTLVYNIYKPHIGPLKKVLV